MRRGAELSEAGIGRPVPDPTPEDALAITRSLRVEGDLRARRLAELIEQACRRDGFGLRQVLDDANAFVARMPTDKVGLLFLQAGNVVQPDPDRRDTYRTHAGKRRSQWPSSPKIAAAMFERHSKKPSP